MMVIVVTAAFSFGGFSLFNYLSSQYVAGPTQVNIMELWRNGSYDEIIQIGKEDLKKNPLDVGNHIFMGFSYFHKGMSEVTVEKKIQYMDLCIQSLRKVLLLKDIPLKAEIFYILGKAYFHKGKYYSDLSIKNLLLALDLKYSGEDIFEYLGLAYSQIGKYQDSNDYFLKAVAQKPTDLLLWTLGQTNFQLQKYDDAIQYLNQSIVKTQDRSLEQRCRFLLGEIYTKKLDFEGAEREYKVILMKNPNSADAHYFLGETYFSRGNKEMARSEWRKAFKIDPLHFNANQRLFN